MDEHRQTDFAGHYIRLPDSAYRAYSDLIQEYDHRGVTWGGNKIGYVVSDAISASFQYEIRLDEVIAVQDGTTTRAEGSQQITKPVLPENSSWVQRTLAEHTKRLAKCLCGRDAPFGHSGCYDGYAFKAREIEQMSVA